MRARARLRIGPGGLTEVMAEAPFAFREAGGVVRSVQAAGGPIGGDELALEIDIEPGASAVMRTVAAQLVQPGPFGEPCRINVSVHVPAGASLDWAPEPTVLVAGCRLVAHTTIELEGDARLRWRDTLVLGRHGEDSGQAHTTLRLLVDGQTVVHHQPDLSPFGIGSHHVVATTVERCGPAGAAEVTDTDAMVMARLPTARPDTVLVVALGATIGSLRSCR